MGERAQPTLTMKSTELLSILQGAVSPVILISGVGLLILSMTNRFGRVVDRSRQLNTALRTAPPSDRARLQSQLDIFFRRARLLRAAIAFAVLSVLLAAILVIALFLTAFLRVENVAVNAALFAACLISVIISLLAFLQDLNFSLLALRLELGTDHTTAD